MFVTNQSIQPTGGGDNNVWMCFLVLQDFGILDHGCSSVEDGSLYVWQILAETSIFVLDLVSQLASVAHDQDRSLTSDWLYLLQSRQHEDGGFT